MCLLYCVSFNQNHYRSSLFCNLKHTLEIDIWKTLENAMIANISDIGGLQMPFEMKIFFDILIKIYKKREKFNLRLNKTIS